MRDRGKSSFWISLLSRKEKRAVQVKYNHVRVHHFVLTTIFLLLWIACLLRYISLTSCNFGMFQSIQVESRSLSLAMVQSLGIFAGIKHESPREPIHVHVSPSCSFDLGSLLDLIHAWSRSSEKVWIGHGCCTRRLCCALCVLDIWSKLLGVFLNQIFLAAQKGLKYALINDSAPIELGEDEPHEETWTDPSPVWNEPEDHAKEGLNNIEYTEHHPVSEPHLVIIFLLRLNRTNGVNCWIQHSHCGDQDSPSLEDQEDKKCNTSDSCQDCTWVDSCLGAQVNKCWDHACIWVQNCSVFLNLCLDVVHLKFLFVSKYKYNLPSLQIFNSWGFGVWG